MSLISSALMEVRDVVVTRGACPVVDRVSLTVRAGEIVALVGPNGAGKTTLMRALAGVERLAGGDVLIDGVSLSRLDGLARARAIGYLPQTREAHWPLSVSEVVRLGAIGERLVSERKALDDEARALMTDLDLNHLTARAITALSGGELARVLLARAMLQGGRVLVADEPTAGVDLAHRLKIMAALKARVAARGAAALVSVHDLGLAARFADRMVVLHQGRIVAEGDARTTLSAAVLRAVWDVDGEMRMIDGVPVLITRAGA